MINYRVFNHTEQTLQPVQFPLITQALNHRQDMHDLSDILGEKKHDIKIQGFSGKFFVREYRDNDLKDIAEELTCQTYCRCATPKVNECNECGNLILK